MESCIIKESGLKGRIVKEIARNSRIKLFEVVLDSGGVYYKNGGELTILDSEGSIKP